MTDHSQGNIAKIETARQEINLSQGKIYIREDNVEM